MATLTPIDKNPFNEFYDATGADKPAPVGKAKLLGNILFGALPGPAKLASLPLNENFRKGFMEGVEKSGRVGVQSMMEALENQYKPDNAVAVNDAGEWLDQAGKVIPSQRRPNLLPITKSQPGEGWFGSNYEGAMPAMADVWNTMGGVAGKGGATLGAGPMLRPALKYQDKIYKAKEGQQHLDALPAHLQETFQKQAMSGEDISNFNFGFINHKGHFLQREDALKYAIDNGLLDPQDAKYGTLVTTMLNDSGGGQKIASQAAGQSREMSEVAKKAKDHFGLTNDISEAGYMLPDGSMLDLTGRHYSGGYIKNNKGYWELGPKEKQDYLKGTRSVDHRELDFMEEGGTDGMRKFMNEGKALRLNPGTGFDTTFVPTDKQLTKVISSHNTTYRGEPFDVDLSNPLTGENIASKTFNKPNVQSIKKWIKEETDKHPELFNQSGGEGKLASHIVATGNEDLSYLLKGKSKINEIGEETGKINSNGISVLKLKNKPENYDANRLVYTENEKILGAMQITKVPNDDVYKVANVYVAPEARRKGIATKLNEEGKKLFGKLESSDLEASPAGEAFRKAMFRADTGTEGKLASQAASSMRNKDLKIEKTFGVNDEPIYTVKNKNGEYVGEARLSHTGEYVVDLGVKPEFRRQGIATDLYNHIEKDLGKKLKPSPVYQTKEGDAFWKNRNKPAPTFYSAAEKAVEGIKQNKASGDQWLSTIGNQKGVKGEELEWTGLKEFLAGKQSVTKQEIQDYLKENKVELKEVWKGGHKKWTQQDSERLDELENLGHRITNEQEVERQALITRENEATNQEGLNGGQPSITKYHNYQLPGGTNYRELLLTLPVKTSPKAQEALALTKRMNDGEFNSLDDAARKDLFAKRDQLLKEGKAEEGTPHKSSHWDEPNILAHMRMNDRTIDGKKSLHLEEIQSDWHQQGRDKGYKIKDFESEISKAKEAKEKAYDDFLNTPESSKDFWKMSKAFEEAKEKYNKLRVQRDTGVPDAPFKKTWHELALKRAIREAAENGYERLSWTPGEAQAARYDLSKQVDRITYDPNIQDLRAYKKDGGLALSQKVEPEKVSDYVGKEAAKKLLETDKNDKGLYKLENADLKIGGEGMKGFYDQIIPKSIEKIAKEFGVKVQKTNLPVNKDQIKDLNEKYDTTKPDEIATAKYQDQWDELVKERRKLQPLIDDRQRKLSETEYQKVQNDWKEVNLKMDDIHHYMVKETIDRMQSKLKGPETFYIDIPENMRQSIVGKGQPLFSGVPTLTPITYDPFNQSENK